MKLKSRLLTAFLILTVLPLMLITLCAGTIVKLQSDSIEQTYDVNSGRLEIITNPTKVLSRMTRSVYNEVLLTTLKDPDKMLEEQYIRSLTRDLNSNFSFIVVRKDKEFTYIGNKEFYEEIVAGLPKFGDYDLSLDGGMFVDGKTPYLLKQKDFYFSDGSEGTAFIITDIATIVPKLKASIMQICWSIVVVILLTAMLLIVWIYRSILMPINLLHVATDEMKKGNLNFSIKGDPEDEIGRLCVDFDEMRERLKELIDVRLKYEEDMKELISNISHDLKTPITAIKGYAEGIMDGVADTKEKQDKYLKTIYTKAVDISALVDELSYYSKIDCNTMPYLFKTIVLDDYFNDCIDEIILDLELRNIKLRYENTTDKSLRVSADGEQLKKVINNIIGNSVKYIKHSEGEIFIKIEDESEEYVKISIGDNGEGIDAKDLPFIFQRFYRADASRNSTTGGSGLGLAITKKIIEEHMGSIIATSEKGKGLTIIFTLRKDK